MKAAGGGHVLDLVKMDADGPEGDWLTELDRILSGRPRNKHFSKLTAAEWGEPPSSLAVGGTRLQVRAIIIEGHRLDARVLRRFQMLHGYTVFRLDAHDGRRWITPEGWDAYSPTGTIARLDRLAAAHYPLDRAYTANSPKQWAQPRPGADNVSRLDLEVELFSVRAMRHVFRVRPNCSLQCWMTLINPLVPTGYGSHWALTLDGSLLEPTFEVDKHFRWRVPEYQAHMQGQQGLHHGAGADSKDDAVPQSSAVEDESIA